MSLGNLDRLGEFLRIRIKVAGPRSPRIRHHSERPGYRPPSELFEEIPQYHPDRNRNVVRASDSRTAQQGPARKGLDR